MSKKDKIYTYYKSMLSAISTMNLHTDIQHITNKQTSMLTDDVDYTQHSSTYTLIITEVH